MNYSRSAMLSLYELKSWELEGRVALTGKNDSWSANLSWMHSSEGDKLKISGPLGQNAILILIEGDKVTIDRGGGDVKTSDRSDEFINEQLGMFVPLQSLRYWVIGLPQQFIKYQDTEKGFYQSGWLNKYMQMQVVENTVLMPKKMTVMNDEIKLKLIIDHWTINDRADK